MAFEAVFDGKEVKVAVDKTHLNYLNSRHNHPERLTSVDDLIKYLRCLWAFVKFVRANRDLIPVKPIEHNAGSFSSNCYWWPLLYYTNRLAEMTIKNPNVVTAQDALSFAFRMKEVDWVDRSNSLEFKLEVDTEMKKLQGNYTRLRFTLFMTVAAIREDEGDFEKASKLYVAASQLDDQKDRHVWGKALLNRSLSCQNFAKYGEAIVWAQQYEAYMKGAVHPELQAWLKDNGTKALPTGIDTNVMVSYEAYKTGTASKPDPVLFSV